MMIDLGHKPEASIAVPSPSKDKAPEKYYPSLHIEVDDANIDEKMMNKDITVTCVVRITGYSKSKRKDYSSENVDLEVRKIDFGKSKDYSSIFDAVMDSPDDKQETDGED